MKLVVLISGSGSNLQAIIDAIAAKQVNANIACVISNKAQAYGLTRAKNADIPTRVLKNRGYPDRQSYDQDLAKIINEYQPDLVVLAGFMRILSPQFFKLAKQAMMNIHPSLLPAYKGLNTHQRVLDAGEQHHGVSVHFVTPELDDGPIIIQAQINVTDTDNADSLQARIHHHEHIIYPLAIQWYTEGRLTIDNDTVFLDNEKSPEQFIQSAT